MVIDVNIGFLNRKILIFSGILALLLVVVLLVLFLFVFRGEPTAVTLKAAVEQVDQRSDTGKNSDSENKSEDMRMWLPAFKKIRRISSKKKGDSFMGSDLSYEDLYTRNKEEFSFKIIAEEELNNEIFYKLESIPNPNLKSEYSKHISWISKSNLIPVKEESYDKKGLLLKEKQFQYKKIDEFWIVEKISVNNVQKKQSTKVNIENIEINMNINDNLFQEKNLKRLPF